MSSNGGGTRSSKPTERNILANVDLDEFKRIRVSIRRSNCSLSGPITSLDRSLGDPMELSALVHFNREGNLREKVPIFGPDIKVNVEYSENEREVTGTSREGIPTSSGSQERSTRQSRSPKRRYSYSKEREGRDRSRRSHSSDRHRRSGSRTLRPLRPGEYIPNHPDIKKKHQVHSRSSRERSYSPRANRSRSRSYGRDRKSRSPGKPYRKSSASPSTSTYRRSVERNRRSHTPTRTEKHSRSVRTPPIYKKDTRRSRSPDYKRKRSSSRDRHRSRSPRKYKSSRRSRSPYRSPPPRHSHSTSKSRRSRSRSRHSKTPPRYREHFITPSYAFEHPEFWMSPQAYRPFFPPTMIPPGMMYGPRMPPRGMYHPGMRFQTPHMNIRPQVPAVKPHTFIQIKTTQNDKNKEESETKTQTKEKE